MLTSPIKRSACKISYGAKPVPLPTRAPLYEECIRVTRWWHVWHDNNKCRLCTDQTLWTFLHLKILSSFSIFSRTLQSYILFESRKNVQIIWFCFRTHVENQNSFNRGTFRNTNKSFNTISRQSTINNRLEVVNKVNYNVPDFHQKEREGIHSWIWYYYLDLHSALQPNNTLWPSLRIDRVSRDCWIEMTFSRHLRASLKSSPPSPLSLSSFSAFQKCSTIVVRLLPTELLTRGGDWYSLW